MQKRNLKGFQAALSPKKGTREAVGNARAKQNCADGFDRAPPASDDVYLDTAAIAAIFGNSPSFWNKLRKKGGGPNFVKFSASVKYRYGDVKAWAAAKVGLPLPEDRAAA